MNNQTKNVAFITGASGFIGYHVSNLLLSYGWKIIGLDSMSNYYDVTLKEARLLKLKTNLNFTFYRGLIQNKRLLEDLFLEYRPNIVIHLAAQAGVRYSIKNPSSYAETNLMGTFQILEMAKKYNPEHLLIASTSSVYGNNKIMPFDENQKTNTPISFYAATKISSECMAHSYSHLYSIPTTIFRFFTVYGPWGRPDMALFKFTNNILSNKPIDIYNNGNMSRDFTYIDDLVKAVYLLISKKPLKVNKRCKEIKNDSISSVAPYRVVNIGNSKPVKLMDYIEQLENILGKVAKKNFKKMQDGDLIETHCDVELLKSLTGFQPNTSLNYGIEEFVKWYKLYYS